MLSYLLSEYHKKSFQYLIILKIKRNNQIVISNIIESSFIYLQVKNEEMNNIKFSVKRYIKKIKRNLKDQESLISEISRIHKKFIPNQKEIL